MRERDGTGPDRAVAADPAGLADVAGFLGGCLPFAALSTAELQRAVHGLRIAYYREGAVLSPVSEQDGLRVLRSGAVDLRDDEGSLIERLGEGDCFQLAGRDGDEGGLCAAVIEDALVYRLPEGLYDELRAGNSAFRRYFTRQRARRLRRAGRLASATPVLPGTVRERMSRDLVTVAPGLSVQETARAMARRRVSSVLVLDASHLVGIVTDRDLRSRVLAEGMAGSVAVREVMTPSPVTIQADATLLDAMLRMTLHELHHLPVVDADGALAGLLSSSDLILARREDPVHLVQHIGRQDDVTGVAALAAQSAGLARRLAAQDMQPRLVAKLLTAISDAATRRLIALAEASLGPAPVPWAWVAFGSQGRAEQLLGADQDNGIVFDDAALDADRAWFAELARRVCDGLAACGYPRCGGGVMAVTEAWRAPLQEWKARVRGWTVTPTPDAVMRVSIFFDPRVVHGEAGLVDELQRHMLAQASRNTIFLAALAAGVLEVRPPLGIFRRFVVNRDGKHVDRLDIKKLGVLPITEIVRLHALAHALAAVNTDDRLDALARCGHLALTDARNLRDALHSIQRVRLAHQAEQVGAGSPVDNFVDPRSLPRLEREQLRDAFTIIHEAQAGVRQAYRAGLG